jgi:hypothetical protein
VSDVVRFTHPDGKVLTLTRNPNDPTKWMTSFEDGTGLCDKLKADFEAGMITKGK